MASIEEVRAAIAQAVEKAGQSVNALQQAADLAEDAQALLSTATQGSVQADVEQANARFAEVVSGVTDLQKHLGAGISQAESINSRL
ncbi:hypothetical protein ACIQMJ_02220 [Actinosynnema sp. NPDC091369]|jgi:uncharacterized phage infection (PIP) family protein YhgE|uniref:Type VII secretion system (Wss) protein ESAT-6 n=1 Tax=Saccharothrix saharensis TaxID=571190 RepID=A0A543JET5_9PSEU|nr:hypothetical protein [Saccharothrix saharensis]TQM81358.1 hypothetical protein FHX81_3723 [Saccharothrix saharensis]